MPEAPAPVITLEQDGAKGRYVATIDGIDEPAELTYSIVNDQLIIADHTGVPDAMRGLGVGKVLVERLVDDARRNNVKIIPLCPYVKAQSQKHPEWADVFQGGAGPTPGGPDLSLTANPGSAPGGSLSAHRAHRSACRRPDRTRRRQHPGRLRSGLRPRG